MTTRRRIDWDVILGPDAPTPQWKQNAASSELLILFRRFDELFVIEDTDQMLRRAVELTLDPIGLIRAGLYVYDEPLNLMLGTWGTNLQREIIDEHHAMFELGPDNRRVIERAVSGEAYWTLVEDCPLIDQSNSETRVVGQGWVVCTPIYSSRRAFGMLYNDAGLTQSPVDPVRQGHTAVLCSIVGALLDTSRHSAQNNRALAISPKHPLVARAVRALTKDPSLGGKVLADQLGTTPGRLTRVFKAEMGQSLVEYRNRLRLDRFRMLLHDGGTNLLAAALAAGFGSYAQFHRVFRAVHGKTPREYWGEHD